MSPAPEPVRAACDRSWSVIPIGLNKNALVPWTRWQKDRPSAEQIDAWASAYSSAAWAVITGAVSGITVLDFDGIEGQKTLERLGLNPHVRTPSGGFHVYVAHDGRRVKTWNCVTSPNGRFPGMDVRGDGGYAGFHGRVEAGEYEQLRPFDPYQLRALPQELLAFLYPSAGPEGEPGPAATPPNPPPGLVDRALERAVTCGRNNAGFWLALQLRDAELAFMDALAIMLRYQRRVGPTNKKGAVEPYTEVEAKETLHSAYSKTSREPWPEVDAGAPNSEPNSAHPHPPAGVAWPSPPEKAAFQGLAGDWVRLINPHTEADPVALLVQLLVAFGSAVGRSPYTEAEAVRHYTNMFEALVGETAKGRKGTSYAWIRRLLELADGKWVKECNVSGLSSGEGLIWHVRDPISRTRPIREKNRTVGYEQELEDAGVLDKRLLVHEGELAGALRAMSREGNTLSAVLRAAWDTGDLRSLTKNAPARATGAHISVIGHVTRDEVNKELNQTDRANGFANRFLWIAVRRSKVLPEGGRLDLREFEEFAERFREVLEMARNVSRVERDAGARDLWAEIYQDLSEGRPGLLGAITSRSEAQVTRLSLLYALLAGRREVAVTDLQAALALWGYCERSARYIFGEAVAETDEAKQLRQLVQVIAGRPGRTITVHWLSNSGPRRYRRNRDRAERDLMELEKQGFGVLRDPPSGPATGRVFVLNPGALDADASDSEPNSGHSHPLHPSECDRKAVEDFLGGTL